MRNVWLYDHSLIRTSDRKKNNFFFRPKVQQKKYRFFFFQFHIRSSIQCGENRFKKNYIFGKEKKQNRNARQCTILSTGQQGEEIKNTKCAAHTLLVLVVRFCNHSCVYVTFDVTTFFSGSLYVCLCVSVCVFFCDFDTLNSLNLYFSTILCSGVNKEPRLPLAPKRQQ